MAIESRSAPAVGAASVSERRIDGMDIEWARKFCTALPHTTENVQWEDDLVFKVGGKMFAIVPLEPASVWISFKCAPEDFADLVERPGIIPAPYLARAHWVAVQAPNALTPAELQRLLERAHELVLAGLPKKTQVALKTQSFAARRRRQSRRVI
jgi:predicted DNA-binding protein (MmcQ/YjbR family)